MNIQSLNEQYRTLSMLFVNEYNTLSVYDKDKISKRLSKIRYKLQYVYDRWLS
jgi:hypothetical protein